MGPNYYKFALYRKDTRPMYILDRCLVCVILLTTPPHSVIKFLEPVRKELCSHCVRDASTLVERIKDRNLADKFILSVYMESLFTSILLDETVNLICQRMSENDISVQDPETELEDLSLRYTRNAQLLYDWTYYRRKNGVAMESMLAPVLTDIFLTKLGHGLLLNIISSGDSYASHIDDTFIIWDSAGNPNELR